MGLAIEVGSIVNRLELDEDAVQWFRDDMRNLNSFLESSGLKPHHEPEDCPVWGADGLGYRGLHSLRRIAAHMNLRGTLPDPDDGESEDAVVQEYYDLVVARPVNLLARIRGTRPIKRAFDHLMLRSDAEGYYLPQDFEQVLHTPDDLEITGGMVGSSNRLLHETRLLAQAIELPLDLDPESEEVWEAWDSPGEGETKWQRYGAESFTCLRLHCAAKHSIKHSAAIVFC